MIDTTDQNHTTNVYRVKEGTNSKLPNKSLFALGTRRAKGDGVEYTMYKVKDAGDKSFKVESKVGVYKVNEEMNKKYGDLSHKDADVAAFAEIGDDAIQAAEHVEKPPPKGDGKAQREINTTLEENGLEIVKIPGRGDCFFQAVAYCVLADSKFLKEHGKDAPWEHENFEVAEKYDAMKMSVEWIPWLRKRVAKAVKATDYVHAREIAFQALDRKRYVKLNKEVADAKVSKEPGAIYLHKKKWSLINGKGEEEVLLYEGKERPFPPIWEGSGTTAEKWREEEKEDAAKMTADPDAQGTLSHLKHVLRCENINDYKAYLKTTDYWADEFAVKAVAEALLLNVIILDRNLGVHCATGKSGDDHSSVILLRDGQHYESLVADDRSVFGAKSKLPIVRECKAMKGGGEEKNGEGDIEAAKSDEEKSEEEKSDEEKSEVKPAESDEEKREEEKSSDEEKREVKPAVNTNEDEDTDRFDPETTLNTAVNGGKAKEDDEYEGGQKLKKLTFGDIIETESIEIKPSPEKCTRKIDVGKLPPYDCPPQVKPRIAALTHAWVYSDRVLGRNVKLTLAAATDNPRDDIWRDSCTILNALIPQTKCTADVNIAILLTDHKKVLPSHGVIGKDNVNTGYAYRCGEIVVYREEEWRKVFIHECFHFFNFDAALDGITITHIFPIPKVDLQETFCEVWARLINCAMKGDVSACIRRERRWACYQMVKVLDYMGLKYADLLRKRNLEKYKEDTNVFAYIVLGAILLQDAASFLEWSGSLNAPKTLPDLILNLHATPRFLADVAKAERKYAVTRNRGLNMSV